MQSRTLLSALLAGCLGLVGLLSPTTATAADFSGQKLTLIVPFKEGGGGSVYTRFFAPFFEKHLPGNPTAIVQNIPGGGSVKGINTFARKAGSDGLLIANTGTGTFFKYLLNDKAVQYDFADFVPLVSSPLGVLFYVRSDLGVATGEIGKLQGREVRYGGRSPTASDLPYLVTLDMLGLELKPIFGLSTGKRRQAFKRGEVDIGVDNVAAYDKHVAPMIEAGEAVPLFTMGYAGEDGSVGRDPAFPDIPTFVEVYEKLHGEKPSGLPWQVWSALFNVRVMSSKMLVLSNKTEPQIRDAYRAAMQRMSKDPDFNSDKARKVLGPYPQSYGESAMRIMRAGAQLDPAAKQWLKTWLKEKYQVEG